MRLMMVCEVDEIRSTSVVPRSQITIIGLTIWFDIHALTIETTNTLDELFPRGSSALKGTHAVVDSFGYGSVELTRILLVPKTGVPAYSSEAFTAAADAIQAIVANPKVKYTSATDFLSVAFAGVSVSLLPARY